MVEANFNATEMLINSIKWRIEDCETRVDTKINKDYVQLMGNHIERGIREGFDEQVRATIDKVKRVSTD